MRKGFTLVELSIVLVIIGLLIGGILAAQSMISTTKIQSQIKQLQQLDIALQNFHTKYQQLPGDCSNCNHPDAPSLCSAQNCQGNNDGWIDYDITHPDQGCGTSVARGECMYFFYDLATMGAFPGIFFPTVPANPSLTFFGDGAFGPVSVLNKNAGILYSQSPTTSDLYWLLMGNLTYGYIGTAQSAITPAEALALDTKLDDGKATSGTVVVLRDGGGVVGSPAYPLNSGYLSNCNLNSDNTQYDIVNNANTPATCSLQIKSTFTK